MHVVLMVLGLGFCIHMVFMVLGLGFCMHVVLMVLGLGAPTFFRKLREAACVGQHCVVFKIVYSF